METLKPATETGSSKLKHQMLPEYTVRVSHKAKNVNLKVSISGAVEVVVPQGFDRDKIPDLIHRKRNWIEGAVERINQLRPLPDLDSPAILPQDIALQAIAETWQIDYCPTAVKHIIVLEKSGNRVTVKGDVANVSLCRKALRIWLTRKAEDRLIPWLRAVSQEHHLPFLKATVRGQKTLWGSCSEQQAISINYKLLFLPRALVHYVFVHELCHTIHMNHSAQYWNLVGQHERDYKRLDKELRTAWRYVPSWAESC